MGDLHARFANSYKQLTQHSSRVTADREQGHSNAHAAEVEISCASAVEHPPDLPQWYDEVAEIEEGGRQGSRDTCLSARRGRLLADDETAIVYLMLRGWGEGMSESETLIVEVGVRQYLKQLGEGRGVIPELDATLVSTFAGLSLVSDFSCWERRHVLEHVARKCLEDGCCLTGRYVESDSDITLYRSGNHKCLLEGKF